MFPVKMSDGPISTKINLTCLGKHDVGLGMRPTS